MSQNPTEIKVCGITQVKDALMAAELGVNAIGLNFWKGTPRRIDETRAEEVCSALLKEGLLNTLEVIAVFVDPSIREVSTVCSHLPIHSVQLHGDESPELMEEIAELCHVYKAFGVTESASAASVRRQILEYSSKQVLLDARIQGKMPGGTGHSFDWDIARAMSKEFEVTLAGGLTPNNISQAILAANPYRVDVASGVETSPGIKDQTALRAFVSEVRSAK